MNSINREWLASKGQLQSHTGSIGEMVQSR